MQINQAVFQNDPAEGGGVGHICKNAGALGQDTPAPSEARKPPFPANFWPTTRHRPAGGRGIVPACPGRRICSNRLSSPLEQPQTCSTRGRSNACSYCRGCSQALSHGHKCRYRMTALCIPSCISGKTRKMGEHMTSMCTIDSNRSQLSKITTSPVLRVPCMHKVRFLCKSFRTTKYKKSTNFFFFTKLQNGKKRGLVS